MELGRILGRLHTGGMSASMSWISLVGDGIGRQGSVDGHGVSLKQHGIFRKLNPELLKHKIHLC